MTLRLAVNGRFLTQPVTGVQRYARELMATLDDAVADGRHDVDVRVLTPRALALPPEYRAITVVSEGRLRGHAWEQLELPRLARGADVLFCPGNTAPLASLWGAIPVVVTVHDLAFRDHPDTVSRAFRAAYEVLVPAAMRKAERVVTVSESERRRMLTSFPGVGERLRAVANGGVPRHQPVPGPDDAEPPPRPFVLYVGALNARKNVQGVLSAARDLLEERADLRLVLVGSGADIYRSATADPRIAAASFDVERRIIWAGSVSDASLVAHYRAASVFLFPSFHEASGLPPVEAMANGCPVVVSDIPALRERCGEAALYCDPHDPSTMREQVSRLLDDADLVAGLVSEGRERAAELTWEHCLDETLDVLREAAAAR